MRLLNLLIERAAQRRPEATAVRADGSTLTYGELARQASGVARLLGAAGVRRRDRVAVWLGKGLRVPVSFHGTFAAGATLVPIDPKAPLDQAIGILRATGATHLISEDSRRDVVRAAAAAVPGLRHVIGVERLDAAIPTSPWAEALAEAGLSPVDAGVSELDPAYILHTSGSTGRPKLILHTHATAMSFVEWAAAEYQLREHDVVTNHSSHHTCFATFDFYAAAHAGATTEILTPAMLMMPGSLGSLLEQQRVTVWYSVPAALVQLSLRGDLDVRDLRSLRWVLFAGETFPVRHLQRLRQQLPGARFSHVYGSTEVNVCTCYHLPPGDLPQGPLPIGRPCSTTTTVVVDEKLEPVPDGDAGELLVRGSTVMSGYWNDRARNEQVLTRLAGPGDIDEIYFRTGDRVRVLADGNLSFVARADRQVKVRGHRVELEEVEGALLSIPVVEEAAVFTVPDGEGSVALRAAVVLGPSGPAITERELLNRLREVLAPQALPAGIRILPALPRTPTGKVDLRALTLAAAEVVRGE